MKKILLSIGLACLAGLSIAQGQQNVTITLTNASGGITTITGPQDMIQQIIVPQAVQGQLPAFNPNGESFTNVSIKIVSGLEYGPSGGTAAYLAGDWEFYQGSSVGLGIAAETTLNATGAGFQTGSVNLELVKNFSNWQLTGNAGMGARATGRAGLYGDFGFSINYNLTQGAGLGFLGGAKSFTFVGESTELQISDVAIGNAQLEKVFRIYVGYAF